MTKWCLLCGGEYVSGTLECADCLVPLSDRRPLAIEELVGADDTSIAYDFDELEPIARLAIDELFAANGVAHAWDASTLVVREDDEAIADELIDAADRDAFLGTDSEQISYELDDWNDDRRAELAAALAAASIEHAWDENGELVVLAEDEERVDLLVDAVEEGRDALEIPGDDDDAGDSPGAQDVLSELFVSADRLMHDPLDHEGVLSFVDAVHLLDALPLPYGFAPAVWDDLCAQVRSLETALGAEDFDDDDIIERATTVRTALRQYV